MSNFSFGNKSNADNIITKVKNEQRNDENMNQTTPKKWWTPEENKKLT